MEVYSVIIGFCQRAGVKALAFDVLYLEPSVYGVWDDEAFGFAIQDFGKFVGTLFLGDETGDVISWPAEIPEPDLTIAGFEPWFESKEERNLEFSRASFPIPEMAQTAHILANVHLDPDPDGIYRRGILFSVFDEKIVPSLSLAAYIAGHPDEPDILINPGRLTIDDYHVPIDSEGSAIINYRGHSGTHDTYSAAAIIQSELRIWEDEDPIINPEVLKDRYVFFGFNAPGLLDLRSSPVGGVYPGVEIYATMLDNLLSEDFIRPFPEILFTIIVFILFTLFFMFLYFALKI